MATNDDDVFYISAKHPQFMFTLVLPPDGPGSKARRRAFRCVKGRVQLQGEWAAELDRLLALPADECALCLYLRKVDKAAADRWLRQQIAEKEGQAVKGPMTSGAMTGLKMRAEQALADSRAQVPAEVETQIAQDLGVAQTEQTQFANLGGMRFNRVQ